MTDSKYTLSISRPAENDLTEIRKYTINTHGVDAANRYDLLLRQAFKDIRDDPFRPGSKDRPEIASHVRSYHITLSRSRAGSGVKTPRHLILYYLPTDNEIAVSRVLHDLRDLARHVPSIGLGPPPESDIQRKPKSRDRGGRER